VHLVEAVAGLAVVAHLRAARHLDAGIDGRPPRPTMQKGVRVTSTRRTGSQKPIATPMRGGLLQKQTGEDGLSMSGWPSETRVTPSRG
jgi:hypothetical protein